MTPALLLSLVTLSPLSLAPASLVTRGQLPIGDDPTLSVAVRQEVVHFQLEGPDQPFLGVVLGSLSYDTTHYLVGLPPLLTDGVVLGYGLGDARNDLRLQLAAGLLPSGVRLFAQGITLADGMVQSSEVMRFAIDR